MTEKAKGKVPQPSDKEASKPVEKVEEKVVETPKPKEKENAPKVKKKQKPSYTRYKVDATGLTRLRPFCERCGPGYFMADHGDRFACGHCGFTRYKRS
jgi:small subunit ribosomal protein S27Ae